jgi:predicted NAD/FAD-binding protein
MLLDILRFNRRAREFLQDPDDEVTLTNFLERGGYSRQFVECYLVPIGAAIWPARPDRLLQLPARVILPFVDNHGLLQASRRSPWQTVQGGAARYVKALTRPFANRIRLNTPVTSIHRVEDGVIVSAQRGAPERFDCVVLATHADQSLALLSDATDTEREILSSIPYQRHDAILHVDRSMLPRSRRAWASRNYHVPAEQGRPAVLTYNVNRLQGLRSRDPICVTLNDAQGLDETKILRQIPYHHPTYTPEGQAAQKRFQEINGKNRTYFCGAYWGYGFHEDGVNSALAVGQCFGRRLESVQG